MKKFAHTLCLVVSLAISSVALSGPSVAATTGWVEDNGGRMRLVITPPDDTGRLRAALQVEPAPGFITYWREPGESGIPPQVSISGADDVRLVSIAYPTPKRMKIAGGHDMGYDGPVTFPLTFQVKGEKLPDMDISAFIGLCKDICIPFQASFHIPSSPEAYAASPVDNALLAVAETTLPEEPSADFDVNRASLTENGIALELTLPKGNNPPEIIIASSKGFVVAAPEGQWQGDSYNIIIPATDIPKAAQSENARWLLLAKSNGRAMETSLVFDTRQN